MHRSEPFILSGGGVVVVVVVVGGLVLRCGETEAGRDEYPALLKLGMRLDSVICLLGSAGPTRS